MSLAPVPPTHMGQDLSVQAHGAPRAHIGRKALARHVGPVKFFVNKVSQHKEQVLEAPVRKGKFSASLRSISW